MPEFQRTAEALFQHSARTFPKFVNGQMLNVARLALKLTVKANRQKIERKMGVVSRTEKLRSKGAAKGWVRIKKRKLGKDPADTFAGRILLAKKRATGRFGIKGDTLQEKVLNLIAAKVRSVAFIKSGWIPAIRDLAALAYGSRSRGRGLDGAKVIGKDKGRVIPARFAINSHVSCMIENSALLRPGKRSAWHGKVGDPFPIAERALRTAMEVATRDMADEFFKRAAIDLKPFGVRLGP